VVEGVFQVGGFLAAVAAGPTVSFSCNHQFQKKRRTQRGERRRRRSFFKTPAVVLIHIFQGGFLSLYVRMALSGLLLLHDWTRNISVSIYYKREIHTHSHFFRLSSAGARTILLLLLGVGTPLGPCRSAATSISFFLFSFFFFFFDLRNDGIISTRKMRKHQLFLLAQ
jgi:hypothetical protein